MTLAFNAADVNAQTAPAGSASDRARQADRASPPADVARHGRNQPLRARSSSRASVRERRLSSLRRAKRRATLEDELVQTLDKIRQGRHLRRGTTAIYVVDANTGRPLYAAHQDTPLNPASNVKLISTAAALDAVGPDYRYVTRLLGPEPSADGVVSGDIYILGDHDPTLRYEHMRTIAQSLVDRGIREVRGDFYVGPQSWRESVSKPRITVRVRGTEPGEPPVVTVEPATDFITVNVTATTSKRQRRTRARRRASRVSLDFQRIENELVGDSYVLEVSGTIAAGRQSTFGRWLARGPQLSAHVLRRALIDSGILVTGTVRRATVDEYTEANPLAAPVELVRHESKPMSAIVAAINKFSINRLADRVLMTAGAIHYGGEPTMEKGVQLMGEWLQRRAGVNPNNVYLDTGSGLSYNTQLTARQIVKVLRSAGGYAADRRPVVAPVAEAGSRPDELDTEDESSPEAAADRPAAIASANAVELPGLAVPALRNEAVFLDSLAVGGVDGTLRRRFRRSSVRGRVIGKTGTLTQVIALSGIVTLDGHGGDRGNAIAFAIVSNGHDRHKRHRVRKEHESVVKAINRYLRARTERRSRRAQRARLAQ